MTGNVTSFPVSQWRRILNRRGARSVGCIVSVRWLRYAKPGKSSTGYFPDQNKLGTPVVLDIMTGMAAADGEQDRKLCEIIVTLEELKEMVATLEAEAGVTSIVQ